MKNYLIEMIEGLERDRANGAVVSWSLHVNSDGEIDCTMMIKPPKPLEFVSLDIKTRDQFPEMNFSYKDEN